MLPVLQLLLVHMDPLAQVALLLLVLTPLLVLLLELPLETNDQAPDSRQLLQLLESQLLR